MEEPSITMMDDIEFHFIELTKLKRSLEELNDPLEIWTSFIRYSETLTEQELENKNPSIKKAHEKLDEISMDSNARLAYDRRRSVIFFHELELQKRYSDGKLEGLHEGKLEDARNFLELDVPLETVLKATGLTREDLIVAGILKKD